MAPGLQSLSRTLKSFKPASREELKQAILLRTDLELGKGKLVSQGSHASVLAYDEARRRNPSEAEAWAKGGAMKIVLKVSGEKELGKLFMLAQHAGLPAALVSDAGHTQIPAGTVTAVGIGPASSSEIDRITSSLKLL